jgi:RNA polymerase sigma factor (sigma-70 family)
MRQELEHALPDWSRIWAACSGRIHYWRVPPRWTMDDWLEEIDAECMAAACLAIRIFDKTRGPSLSSFVYHRMLASALARYRREWSYAALRDKLSSRAGTTVVPMEDRFADQDEEDRLKDSLSHLRDDDRLLLEYLFWDGRTESEIASGLGITQQAVNKRKRKILSELRRSFEHDGRSTSIETK